eukprot:TRINITY_DN4433_c0_g1_i11.p1 TRINITY_DN4433_c0_g1~~TRINITY_DN4433_c0_g1_i11.p1  ORF type:complete len:280 (+),score=65.20 TRINITY_DN4433_c0_g1_i11:339-1178(+)
MPDYHFYRMVLDKRIEETEKNMLRGGVWGKDLVQQIDKKIQEVIDDTNQEFYMFFKERDEERKEMLEARMKAMLKGKSDPELMYHLQHADPELARKTELKLLSIKGASGWSILVADEEDVDSDDELTDDGENLEPKKSLVPVDEKTDGRLYKDYDKIQLWRKEDDSSPFSGVDKIFAHLKQRRREAKKNKEESAIEEEEMSDPLLKLPKEQQLLAMALHLNFGELARQPNFNYEDFKKDVERVKRNASLKDLTQLANISTEGGRGTSTGATEHKKGRRE